MHIILTLPYKLLKMIIHTKDFSGTCSPSTSKKKKKRKEKEKEKTGDTSVKTQTYEMAGYTRTYFTNI